MRSRLGIPARQLLFACTLYGSGTRLRACRKRNSVRGGFHRLWLGAPLPIPWRSERGGCTFRPPWHLSRTGRAWNSLLFSLHFHIRGLQIAQAVGLCAWEEKAEYQSITLSAYKTREPYLLLKARYGSERTARLCIPAFPFARRYGLGTERAPACFLSRWCMPLDGRTLAYEQRGTFL